MSLRSTLIALAIIIALCGGGLYVLSATFSRDAQIRQAELGFAEVHKDQIAAANAQLNSKRASREADPVEEAASAPAYEGEEELSLDDWYGEAGKASEPFDPVPEDKSYLINDTQPIMDTEPIG